MSDFTVSYLPLLAVILPLLSVPVLPLFKEKVSNRFTVAIAIVDFFIVLSMYPAISHGTRYLLILNTGLQIKISFMADALSFLAGLISIVVWMLASI